MVWYGMEDDFSIFILQISFYFISIPYQHSSIPYSIPYQKFLPYSISYFHTKNFDHTSIFFLNKE